MAKKPYTNTTDKIIHIGNCTIWPGQTREVDETLLPDYRPPARQEPQDDTNAALAALLDGSVNEVRDALESFDADQLDTLESLESAGKDRKGVAEAIADERLRRAARAELDAFASSLEGLDEEGLLAKLDEVGDDLDRQKLIQTAIEMLDQGDGESEAD